MFLLASILSLASYDICKGARAQMRRDDPRYATRVWTPAELAGQQGLERQLRMYVAKLRTGLLEPARRQVHSFPPHGAGMGCQGLPCSFWGRCFVGHRGFCTGLSRGCHAPC